MFFVDKKGNSRRRHTAVLCAYGLSLLAVALFTGCGREQSEFKIGFIAPLRGEYEHLRSSYLQGAELAVDEVTEGGGIKQGKTVIKPVLVVRDNEGATEKAVEYTHELINQEKVSAIIGLPFSRNAVPVGKIADRYNIPMITPLSTHPATTKNRFCVYRVCFTDEFQGRLLAAFTFRDLEKGTAAILYDDAMNYSSHLAAVYSTHYTDLGGKIVAAETYASGETDFLPYLERIRNAEPEVIFLPNFLSDLRIQMRQLRELGISATVIGSETMDADTEEEKRLLEGAYFCAHFSPDNPSREVRRFVEAYSEFYEQQPTYGAALNYDACRLLFAALESAKGRDPESVCRALAGIDTFTGVTGTMVFGEGGDPKKSAVILRWVDMEKRFYKEIQP
jgi:branched-chain amino acid transport system substrate-binding protein